MRILGRARVRFVVEMLALAAAAAASVLASLTPGEVALVILAVFGVSFALEIGVSREPRPRHAPRARPTPPRGQAHEPEPEQAEPEPARAEVGESTAETGNGSFAANGSAAVPRPRGRPWNVWEIQQALRESGGADDERQFLLHYLRDYADAAGVLPTEFDELVQEAFGNLFAG